MTNLVIAVDPVPYEKASPDFLRQQYAQDELSELASEREWVIARNVVLAMGGSEAIRRFPPRDLPFIHDLMQFASPTGAKSSDWIGVLNSDIVVTPKFFDAFQEMEDSDVIMISRTDVPLMSMSPEENGTKLMDGSTDGLFVRQGVWGRIGGKYPDFILGEPAWGFCARLWAKRHRLRIRNLQDHECLHVSHEGVWKQTVGRSKGYWHNRRLYVRFLRGLPTRPPNSPGS